MTFRRKRGFKGELRSRAKEKPAMGKRVVLTGRIVSGAKKAAYFTQLDWVQEQCLEKLRFKPYPGTLNIELTPASLAILQEIDKRVMTELVPSDPTWCQARVLSLSIGHISGALVTPSEDVRIHGRGIVEVIAPVRLKDALNLKDGDEVTLVVEALGHEALGHEKESA
jgi:CTP-dependent riboflavin kinase